MKITLLALLCFCAFFYSKAQFVSGNAFLQGKYMEVGVAPNGTLGSNDSPPLGFHSRSSSLGVVADVQKDGWMISDGIQPYYLGDYITPGSPVEIWTIKANNKTGAALNRDAPSVFSGGLDGSIVSGSFVAASPSCVWQGLMDSLLITQKYSINYFGFKVKFQVKIQNNSTKTINEIYYNRNVDPDNDVDFYGAWGHTTYNQIVQQTPNPSNTSLVTANGYFDKSYFAIASKDPRAKVYFIKDALVPKYSIDTIYSGLGVDTGYLFTKVGDTLFSDVGIGIVFKLDSLAPGDSTQFEFEYVFQDDNSCEHLLMANSQLYKDGDTIYGCKDEKIAVEIFSTNSNKWNWNASPNIDTSYAPIILITVDSLDAYTAISVDSSKCTNAFDTFRIVVKAINYPKPKVHNIGPNLWVDSTYTFYIWYRNFMPIPFSKSPSYFAKFPGDYFVEVIDSNGCRMRSDTIYIDPITAKIDGQNRNLNLIVSPNPCVDKIHIGYEKPFVVSVYNTLGQELIRESKNNILDLSVFVDGLYFIEVIAEDGTLIGRRKILKRQF